MKLLIVTQAVDKEDSILGFFHSWIEKLAENFDSIVVICLKKGTYNLPHNVNVYSLGKEEGKTRLTYVYRFFRYIISLRKEYDSVFIHMNQVYILLGACIWKLLDKRIYLWYAHKSSTFSLKIAIHFVTRIFTPNKTSFRIENRKVQIMGHGIDTDYFSPCVCGSTENKFKIITIGRVSAVKGYMVMVDALSRITDSRVVLEIVGDPVTQKDVIYFKKLKQRIKALDLEHRIIFTGSLPNNQIVDVLRCARVFINMSNTGSMDKAILEAMAVGIPVITSNEAFIEILSPYGLMCKRESAEDLAQKILQLKSLSRDIYKDGLLRNVVVTHHNINTLIYKMSNIIKTDFNT